MEGVCDIILDRRNMVGLKVDHVEPTMKDVGVLMF